MSTSVHSLVTFVRQVPKAAPLTIVAEHWVWHSSMFQITSLRCWPGWWLVIVTLWMAWPLVILWGWTLVSWCCLMGWKIWGLDPQWILSHLFMATQGVALKGHLGVSITRWLDLTAGHPSHCPSYIFVYFIHNVSSVQQVLVVG